MKYEVGYIILHNTEEFLTSNCLHSSTDRTSGYGLEDVGSNPAGDTKKSLDANICKYGNVKSERAIHCRLSDVLRIGE